ncbi:DNA mismatch repair protein Mlh1 [Paracoccidioides lutzii Pb01]|uniref:DNA mismatch repair protein Mlh1 n=1 Tax=Paracoccidioides lutzii (strain ATCC MYA-826 / Pb01) TaxID=502779 RepID=C1GUT9_PARBA|nr:DNA mismatch repair protein Mlh1 [Paracoccidioides lutzii Pb01]EEH40357.2 DNA mismatch repair protein Mlh1 [Paracoccidioides lutzii Pb01]
MADEVMDVDSLEPRGTKRSATDAGLQPQLSRKIQALDPDVVNKIAAGEIIVAPMHALKELIENSIDAGATSIEILVKDGGLKLLQITDNGHGIECDDLGILCERFTTSKLKAFEDLSSIGTYGFRGEALASISHIAHLTVTTKTAGSSCAWKAHYNDGKLVPAKPGQSAEPKPTAGRGGTQITVEDLFYNIPTRRRAFRSSSEEYAKILDVVGRYAVHCSGVAVSCKKHGDAGVSISTSTNSTTVDRIRQIHGSAVASELVNFNVEDPGLGFRASGWVSNANYHVKRTTILLFINHRSVESSTVRRAIEQTYSNFLPKGGHPFTYLDLEIEPQRVDVNVHPTKREVNFLNEDEIISSICTAIQQQLATVDSSRTFMVQTLLPVGRNQSTLSSNAEGNSMNDKPPTSRTLSGTKRPYENNLVRTDATMRKITSMLPPASSQSTPILNGQSQPQPAVADDGGLRYENTDREPTQVKLTSVKSLRAAVRSSMHNNLTELFASLTYVGLVDERRRVAAIQSGVKLFLVDYGMVISEFFYQIGLTDFGNFGRINLESSPQLVDLLYLAVALERDEHRARQEQEGIPASEIDAIDFDRIVTTVATQLIERREMLDEYFSLSISEEGNLLSIPLLLKGYMPSLAKLPRFLLRLGPYVDWTDEEACFSTFLRELAAFYTPEQLPTPPLVDPSKNTPRKDETTTAATANPKLTPTPASGDPNGPIISPTSTSTSTANEPQPSTSTGGSTTNTSTNQATTTDPSSYPDPYPTEDPLPPKEDECIIRRRAQISWMLEHVLFPSLRARLVATNELVRGVVEVANLKSLYRVFERC